MADISIIPACNVVSYNGLYGKLETREGEAERFISYGRDIRISQIFRCRDDGTYYLVVEFIDNDDHCQKLFVSRKAIAQPGFYEDSCGRGADLVIKRSEILQAYLN